MSDALLGPYAGLALALLGLFLFFRGRILSDKTVRREDFEALRDIHASNVEVLKTQTKALNKLVAAVNRIQRKNGGV